MKLTTMPRGGSLSPRSGGGTRPGEPVSTTRDPVLEDGPTVEAAEAVNRVHPMDVVAIEVYRGPAETPGPYIDSNSRCGVILIWTRNGQFRMDQGPLSTLLAITSN